MHINVYDFFLCELACTFKLHTSLQNFDRILLAQPYPSYLQCSMNLLLTDVEGHTGEYWPKVVAVWTEQSEVCAKTTEGQYSPVRLKLARLVSSLLYGTRAMLVLNLLAFENKNMKPMTVDQERTK